MKTAAPLRATLTFGVLASLVVLLPGCGGCTLWPQLTPAQKLQQKLAEKAKPKPKPDFEAANLTLQPNDGKLVQTTYKPGHWNSLTVDVLANNADYSGQLAFDPIEAKDMPVALGFNQPIHLPRGQKRRSELTFLVPPRYDLRTLDKPRASVPVTLRLGPRGGPPTVGVESTRLRPLEDFQFYMVVLAKDPESYRYIEKLPALESLAYYGDAADERFFRLVLCGPPTQGILPLPTQSLAWTNVAYVVWDDAAPDTLSATQQQALLDWLHWGGQLLISGPDSLVKLRNSFLKDLLPADSAGVVNLPREELEPLVEEGFLLPAALQKLPATLGVEQLEVRPAGQVILPSKPDSGPPLVVEREVGRGRVVVTAFRLNDPHFRNWMATDDAVFNAVLLRRPARRYAVDSNTLDLRFDWSIDLATKHSVGSSSSLDPRWQSKTRYFARDTEPAADLPQFIERSYLEQQAEDNAANRIYDGTASSEATFGQSQPTRQVAAWDDFNRVSQLSRDGLLFASGLRVPDRQFVLYAMAGYLLLLVPVNWLFFRLLGRVEWAWIAAPLITLGYSGAVVWWAQLNLGFARARTEINLVEVQPEYDRAHVSRYTWLYASLATWYDAVFTDPTAVCLPFPDGTEPRSFQARSTLYLDRSDKVLLEDFEVASNSQGLLHSEHFIPLGGSFALTNETGADGNEIWTLHNRSPFALHAAEVHTPDGWYALGEVAGNSSLQLDVAQRKKYEKLPAAPAASEVDLAAENLPGDGRPVRAALRPDSTDAEIRTARIGPLLDLARTSRPPQEYRLIGWSEDRLPGMDLDPVPEQERFANVWVVHLRYGTPAPPAADQQRRGVAEDELRKQQTLELGGETPAETPAKQ